MSLLSHPNHQNMNFCFAVPLSLISSFFFFNILSSCTQLTEAEPTYLWHYCQNTTLFAPNSTYQTSLNTLLSSLSSTAAADADGFANATVGKNPPDRTYGLFLCRGDITAATCGNCIANASKEILRKCPKEKDSIIWYEKCMLRYSNQSIFSVKQERPAFILMNLENISSPSSFSQLLKDTTNKLIQRAASDGSGKRFAVEDADITSSNKLYTLAQCTPDLTTADCKACLQVGIDSLPSEKAGGRFLAPSCNVRFELYEFYNETVFNGAPAPAPTLATPPATVVAPPSPSSTVRSKGAVGLCFLVNFAFFVLLG